MTRLVHDVLMVGGGPAGAALGAELAAAGRDVVIVEREPGPHDKVCGDFLSGEAIEMLARLGVDCATLGAVPINAVGVSRGSWRMQRPLPFRAMSLTRRALDEALLARAVENGAKVLRGAAVRELAAGDGLWRAILADGREICALDAVLATGKHDLRGQPRPPGRQNDMIGFKTYFRLVAEAQARLDGKVEIGLFPGGYAGLEPVEGGRANLCLVVTQGAFARLGGRWETLLDHIAASVPTFGAALDGAEPLSVRPLAIARIPYGLVRAQAGGLWLVGDQAAVIPSFAGEGVTIALHSARLAARCLVAGRPVAEFQAALARDLRGQIRLATALSRLVVRPAVQRLAPAIAPALVTWLAAATRLRPRVVASAAGSVADGPLGGVAMRF